MSTSWQDGHLVWHLQRVSQIEINVVRWLILSHFWLSLHGASNFDAAGAFSKIGWSLKMNRHKQIKLAQIGETQCISCQLGCTKCHSDHWLITCQPQKWLETGIDFLQWINYSIFNANFEISVPIRISKKLFYRPWAKKKFSWIIKSSVSTTLTTQKSSRSFENCNIFFVERKIFIFQIFIFVFVSQVSLWKFSPLHVSILKI